MVRSLAAHEILHQLLNAPEWETNHHDKNSDTANNDDDDDDDDTNKKTKRDRLFATMVAVVQEFPQTCQGLYECLVETRRGVHRLRRLSPLARVVCWNPPLSVVQAVYEAYPAAIRQVDPTKGATPLLYACSFAAHESVVDYLMAQYPDSVSRARFDGALPLAMACTYRAPPAVLESLMHRYPQGMAHAADQGWYPLHAAVACQAPLQVIQALVQGHAPSVVDTHNPTQSTALHLACSRRTCTVDVIAVLVQAAPHAMVVLDSQRMTPWVWAVSSQSLDVIQWLLQYFAADSSSLSSSTHPLVPRDPIPPITEDGRSILDLAVQSNTADVVDCLAQAFPALVQRPRGQETRSCIEPVSVVVVVLVWTTTTATMTTTMTTMTMTTTRRRPEWSRS